VAAVLEEMGLNPDEFSRFFENFSGVKRRQEVLGKWRDGSKEVVLIDDFAHHPTAVRETLRAVRNHYASYRIIAVFEPRSNTSKRKFFQEVYPLAFEGSDLTVLKAPADYESIPRDERLDIEAITEVMRHNGRAGDARAFFDPKETVNFLVKSIQPGDVVVFMSNGSMDDVPRQVKEALDERYGNVKNHVIN
jgi:UDP-N-acetylmuramate: L-alanyl-gamma-D-glutamyl-meso-diaminopimelate ligase